jgi:alpha-beta hydrolase superfamily lysophospholipase
MQEQDIRFRSSEIELAGTIALPDSQEPFPGVLFVAGSGQIDRNENSKKYKLNAFYDIFRYLAEHGIASLRYDKRGVGQSGGDYWQTGFHDRVRDASAALEYIRQQPNFQPEKIFVLGHSEGSLIAMRLAGSNADVAGIILLSGAAQSGEAVLKWQALQIAKGLTGINGWIVKTFRIDVSKAQQKTIDKIKRSKKPFFRQKLLVKIPVRWLREFMAYDPAEDLSRIMVPVLGITGSKDIQVDPADLERMAHLLNAPFEHHLISGMTHVLRVQEGDASISKYKEEIKRPVEPKLLELILHWIEDRIGEKSDIR